MLWMMLWIFVSRFISLGEGGKTGPYVDDDGLLKISMKNGDICEEDNKLNYSSRIIFICDQGYKVIF